MFVRSCWNHRYGEGVDSNIFSGSFFKFAWDEIDRWLEVITDWVILSTNLYIVHYENLLNNWQFELKNILKFLHLELNNTRFECTITAQQETSKRNKHKLSKNPFNARLTRKIEDTIISANSLLVKYGHQPLPMHLYKSVVN